MLKKTCAATGLLIGAAAGALFMSSPAHAGGDKNVNINKIYNVNCEGVPDVCPEEPERVEDDGQPVRRALGTDRGKSGGRSTGGPVDDVLEHGDE